ncbi:unnamed protein product [Rhizophagus irregularis]|nr:unnamed protein product [Rhizophagus irregularis]CAB4418855.1 unnamed protein product [Rhizophagus irregularis]
MDVVAKDHLDEYWYPSTINLGLCLYHEMLRIGNKYQHEEIPVAHTCHTSMIASGGIVLISDWKRICHVSCSCSLIPILISSLLVSV